MSRAKSATTNYKAVSPAHAYVKNLEGTLLVHKISHFCAIIQRGSGFCELWELMFLCGDVRKVAAEKCWIAGLT